MILQSLVDYYDYLLREKPGEIARPGWCSRRVSCYLVISRDGELVNVLVSPDKRGDERTVPEQVKRSSGVAANFLCDTLGYMLGVEAKDDSNCPSKRMEPSSRSLKCFEASKARHEEILEGVDSDAARAILRYYKSWDPALACEHPVAQSYSEVLLSGGNITFCLDGAIREEAIDDFAVRNAWEAYALSAGDDSREAMCLVTGDRGPVARLHPAIKGVRGAQSAGASLVGFNDDSMCSYGHDGEQGMNAPVSERAAFAYATALNYLLGKKEHCLRLGDTTIVFWALKHDDECCLSLGSLLGGIPVDELDDSREDQGKRLGRILGLLADARAVDDPKMSAPFFVLGLAPNAARLSVRFFWRDTFGHIVENIAKHYERLAIVRPSFDLRGHITPYFLLMAAENENTGKKSPIVSSQIGGSLLRAILGDTAYPAALYENILLRVRATQGPDKVSRVRAAAIKAYLLKNSVSDSAKEVATVELNKTSGNVAYRLGRLFSLYEGVQDGANPGINSTISDKYLNSACATPAAVFPVLIKLSEAHLKKIKAKNKGLAISLEKQIGELMGSVDEPGIVSFPKRLSNEEQGQFLLGYYHQKQARFQKKADKQNQDQED